MCRTRDATRCVERARRDFRNPRCRRRRRTPRRDARETARARHERVTRITRRRARRARRREARGASNARLESSLESLRCVSSSSQMASSVVAASVPTASTSTTSAPRPRVIRRASPSPELECGTPCRSATAWSTARCLLVRDGGKRTVTSSAAAATAASAKPGPEDGVASAGWPTSSQHSHPGFGFDTVNNFAARLAARSSFLLFAASEGIALPKRVDVGSRRCPPAH